MNKYIISYNIGKGSTSLTRYANTREEAMARLCKQFGWDERITWFRDYRDWADGIFVRAGYNRDYWYEFRIVEVTK